jgi:tetratricopeptide (TPR) repeat protein
MKHFMIKAGMLALLLCLASAGWAQKGGGSGGVASGQPAKPAISKAQESDYKAYYDARLGDPNHAIALGEAFLAKYPDSPYLFAVYSAQAGYYFQTSQTPKMLEVGAKALVLNPDDVDVLPLMAYAIPRQVTGKTPDGPDQMKKAAGYAHHGIDLVSTMVKPTSMDDAAFAKLRNEKLYMCHSGLGTIGIKTGQYAGAAAELNQAVALTSTPDMVDFYLLGVADEQTSHFTEAISAYTKCSANGSSMQGACKAGLTETKDKAKNNLEAPK